MSSNKLPIVGEIEYRGKFYYICDSQGNIEVYRATNIKPLISYKKHSNPENYRKVNDEKVIEEVLKKHINLDQAEITHE